MSPSFYEILGVSSTATLDEIRIAYHRLANEYHPDKHANQNDVGFYATQFRHIHEIFQVLSDPIQRGKYDDYLKSIQTPKVEYTTQQPKQNPPPPERPSSRPSSPPVNNPITSN